jgi:hypothetical protein
MAEFFGSPGPVLLKTAVDQFETRRGMTRSNAIFDDWSQRSFITIKFLGLRNAHRESIRIAVFGGGSDNCSFQGRH